MKRVVNVIELEEGNFRLKSEEIIYINEGESIRFISGSKKNAHLKPLLLTDRRIKRTIYESTGEVISDSGRHLKEDLNKRYKIIHGQLDREGYWIADKTFKFIGPISIQMVFCRDKGEYYHIEHYGRPERIIVEPTIIHLDSLNIMSVFPRCIGTIDKWSNFFNYQISLGYNAFHFPPLQKLGSSNSYYSIEDQSVLNPQLFPLQENLRYQALDNFIKDFNQRKVFFFTDLILNHTSTTSEWLKDDPDAAYNVQNTPSLQSSFMVDQLIYNWGNKITQGTLQGYNKITIDNEDDLRFLEGSLRSQVKLLNMSDYFQLDPNISEELLRLLPPSIPSTNIFAEDPSIQIERFISINLINLGVNRMGVQIGNLQGWSASSILYEKNDLINAMKNVNNKWRATVEGWMDNVPVSVINELRGEYLSQGKQPQKGVKVAKTAFTQIKPGYYILNNGWVLRGNPLENFATSINFHYLRRNVHIWSDLIKLRFGIKKQDSPKLWKRFKAYVQLMAKYFNGVRLDNCHGTPLRVGEYFMRKARKVNPRIIVFAELFTNSKQEDAIFIKRMGINALVLEIIHFHQANCFVETYYSHSGKSSKGLGSLSNRFEKDDQDRIFVNARMPVYINYDLSHDNLTYVQKNRWHKQLPLTVLLSSLGCCLGTNKGYDQYYQKKIYVTEERQLYQQDSHVEPSQQKMDILKVVITYTSKNKQRQKINIKGSWSNWSTQTELNFVRDHYECELFLQPGIYQYKFIVNNIWCVQANKVTVGSDGNHCISLEQDTKRRVKYINLEGVRKVLSMLKEKYNNYTETYMLQKENMVQIVKESESKDKYIFIIGNLSDKEERGEFRLPGQATCCQIWTQSPDKVITQSYCIREFFDIKMDVTNKNTLLCSGPLPRGFCCIIECKIQETKQRAIENLKVLVNKRVELPELGVNEINHLMFGSSKEDEIRLGSTTYAVPGAGQLIYGGLGGIYRTIRLAMRTNKLYIPLFNNLRDGNWLLEYYIDRFSKSPKLHKIVLQMQEVFTLLKEIPRHQIPYFLSCFISTFVGTIRNTLGSGALNIRKTEFSKNIILASYQFFSDIPTRRQDCRLMMAAGLPYFCTGWTRSWGRDTFVSIELLLLNPPVFRNHILTYASMMRHGLIPNLLDLGQQPRYNSRDATWWFVRAVYEYVNNTKDYQILHQPVEMTFLSDHKLQHERLFQEGVKVIRSLQEIIQIIFQSTVDGIYFREWDAGILIDAKMRNEGFNISLQVDPHSGFILGGNMNNCLTWMDKMGSSESARSKGSPATSRNGAPVELVGLLKFCLTKFDQLYHQGRIKFNTVKLNDQVFTFAVWANQIQNNFEKWFWIPEDLSSQKYHKSIEVEHVKIKGMYKDIVRSQNPSEQYRLRPNALITLALAPELLTPEHAVRYLSLVSTRLLRDRSIGISTLDRIHASLYCQYYDNDDDSDNYITSHGFSYHNGPEWIWLYGFYIKALLNFSSQPVRRNSAMAMLQNHINFIKNDLWMSLPQLTNINGQYNKLLLNQSRFSCSAQAWSISSMLLALKAIENLKDTE